MESSVSPVAVWSLLSHSLQGNFTKHLQVFQERSFQSALSDTLDPLVQGNKVLLCT